MTDGGLAAHPEEPAGGCRSAPSPRVSVKAPLQVTATPVPATIWLDLVILPVAN